MVIAGKIRGNAPQLGRYLFTPGNNEKITILHLDGRENATMEDFKDFLYSVELNSELTRSKNSAYHAYINPNPEDTTDRVMTKEEWLRSCDILTQQLKYEDQRHGAVLHDLGNGRVHVHIVYERYNHERGVMATYDDNYKAHDRARAQMEKEFEHKRTPKKNPHRDQHKQTLTAIWHNTSSAGDFIKEAEKAGYKIAKANDRRPFRVVDEHGVSFDLVKMIDGAKTKDVRDRFASTSFVDEKTAIQQKQSAKQERKQVVQDNPKQEPSDTATHSGSPAKTPAPNPAAQDEARQKFLQQAKETRERNRSLVREITLYVLIALRVSFLFKGQHLKEIKPDRKLTVAAQFADNAFDIVAPKRPPPEQEPQDKAMHYWEAAQTYKPT